MNPPLVSIIIPVHNRKDELRQAIDCVLAQTSADWELVIVDDRSTDGAAELAQHSAAVDSRIKAIKLDAANVGAPAARNAGAAASHGDLLIFLDSDDVLDAQCVEKRSAFMLNHPDLDFAVYPCELFRMSPGDANVLWNRDDERDDLIRLLERDVPWQTTSPIWRRAALDKIGPWKDDVLNGQDWEFHIRAVLANLKYAREGRVDHYWRMPSKDRDSIGKESWLSGDHARRRFDVLEHVLVHLRASSRWDQSTRLLMGGLWFQACWWLGQRFSSKEARRHWRRARTLDIVDAQRYRQGLLALWRMKFGAKPDVVMNDLRDRWPREMISRPGRFFNRAPIPGKPPSISVVMSAYNVEKYVEKSVESILCQTHRDFEFIIIDDGSTDSTTKILKRLAEDDGRIRLISRENKGLTVSLNEGVSLARANVIARMDADDIASKERFAIQIAYLNANTDCVLVGSRVMLIDPFDVPIIVGEHVSDHASIDREMMLGKTAVYHPSVLMRKAALNRVGNYAQKYNNAEDLDLFLKLAEVGRLHNVDDTLLDYRRHPESVNHLKFERQWKLVREIVADAHQRRGTAIPADWAYKPWTPEPHRVQVKLWGWRALQQGRKDVAKKHGLSAIRHDPFNLESWKLLACAIRGR